MEIDLDKIDASVLDIDTSQIGLRKNSSKGNTDEYDEEDIEKEGGDNEEQSSASKDGEDGNSPDPLRGQSRIPPQVQGRPQSRDGKKEVPKKRSKNQN